MKRGKCIVIEGIDGSGKSTLVRGLHEALVEQGHLCISTFLPSNQNVGALIRNQILTGEMDLHPAANALLFAADRVAHYHQVIEPVLAAGGHVICDRGLWSMLTYQSYREEGYSGVDVGEALDNWLYALTAFVPNADLTLFVDTTTTTAAARLSDRKGIALEEGAKYELSDIQEHVLVSYRAILRMTAHGGFSPGTDLIAFVSGEMNQEDVLANALEEVLNVISPQD